MFFIRFLFVLHELTKKWFIVNQYLRFSAIYLKCSSVVCVGTIRGLGGLACKLSLLYISDIIQFLDHKISSSTSQLIKGKSRNLQKLLMDFNGTTIVSNALLSSDTLPIIFVLYSREFLALVFLSSYFH